MTDQDQGTWDMSVRTMRERHRVTRQQRHFIRRRVCDRLETAAKLANEQARKDQTEQERGIVEKKLMNGRVEKKGCKKGSMGNKLDWYGAKDNGGTGSKGKRQR